MFQLALSQISDSSSMYSNCKEPVPELIARNILIPLKAMLGKPVLLKIDVDVGASWLDRLISSINVAPGVHHITGSTTAVLFGADDTIEGNIVRALKRPKLSSITKQRHSLIMAKRVNDSFEVAEFFYDRLIPGVTVNLLCLLFDYAKNGDALDSIRNKLVGSTPAIYNFYTAEFGDLEDFCLSIDPGMFEFTYNCGDCHLDVFTDDPDLINRPIYWRKQCT